MTYARTHPFHGCGILYAVTGEQYFREARTSIRSVRAIHPTLPITVAYAWNGDILRRTLEDIPGVTLLDLAGPVQRLGLDMRDGMERSRGIKISTIDQAPYEFTLFLDSDTYLRRTLVPLFTALKEGDTQLVLTNEPVARYPKDQYARLAQGDRPVASELVTLSNPRFFNSGVFLFRRSARDLGVGRRWVETFLAQAAGPATSNWSRLCDQSALNATLQAMGEVPRRVLPNTVWNAQCKILCELWHQGRWQDIHILHCKLVHHVGADPETLVAQNYIRKFRLAAEA